LITISCRRHFAWPAQALEEGMSLKKAILLAGIALVVGLAVPLHAQTGCADSPEDPTIALALVGGAGAIVASLWRFRRK
jgi:XrtJ-associated TM-motif-TM protein